ncbi:MAG: tail fiber domain-containing protein [Bacteroidales bacterium]|nr:tail fiber domain-containing protein [Bacteroidales bacterium]
MGDGYISYAGIEVGWSITSDKRLKADITKSDLGLQFINKLNPVSYTRLNEENKKTEYGFIAQEVEAVLTDAGSVNSGILTIDDKGYYSMRYNDLMAPMVKAIQELTKQNEELLKRIEQLENN